MGRKSRSYTQPRTRKERALRYVLRRRPCVFILLFEIAFFVLFTAICVVCTLSYIKLRRQDLLYMAEDKLLKEMGNHITFAHCNYIPTETFNTEFCETRIREESYAYRHFELSPDETQETCIDRQEQIVCHEIFDNADSNAIWLFDFDEDFNKYLYQCPGLLKTGMPYAKFEENVLAYFPNATKLASLQGKYILAQELVAKCPLCSVRTRQFAVQIVENGVSRAKCFVKLKTDRKGWPAIAERCDDVNIIMHASDECEEPAAAYTLR